ncbi:hypothetical protein IKN40_06750 [bacterium]|nr:hypothetical protein [bacterium]
MKVRLISTGEIIEVTPYPTWYKENGQGPDRREFDEDELEFIPNPNSPKMISLNDAKEWLIDHAYDYLYGDIYKDEKMVEDFYEYFK